MRNCTKEQLIEFENRIKGAWEAGELPFLIHLSGGNEDQLIEIFDRVQPGDWVFSTHRNHYHALLSGMAPERLAAAIHRGDSMFVYGRQGADMPVNFLTSSILAGTCGIAAGVALAIRESSVANAMVEDALTREPHVWCFLGDGAEEQGHFYEAAMFVECNELPCTFIVEDNNRSVDTNIVSRRGPKFFEVEKQISMATWFKCVNRYSYVPTYPHAGSGCKHHIQFKPVNKG